MIADRDRGAQRAQRRELLVATRNPGKIRELRGLLPATGRTIVDLDEAGISLSAVEELVEDGDTFEANALAKARYFHARAGGRAVLADDSGLCVLALGGAPGVRSRRYAGAVGTDAEVSAANSRLLLHALTGHGDRRAEFVCAIAYIDAETEFVTIGRTRGQILDAPGGSAGFGYDPLFWSDELNASFGEVDDDAKSRVSHRARAITEAVARLRALDAERARSG